jgi:hypothetical protein
MKGALCHERYTPSNRKTSERQPFVYPAGVFHDAYAHEKAIRKESLSDNSAGLYGRNQFIFAKIRRNHAK